MSAKGNKAKASKNAPKDPTPKSVPSAGRLPVRSPIDDGMCSQMFNLPPALQYRRRDSFPLVPGLPDPPRKKRKSKVSVENTPASAADKSSSAEDALSSTSAVNKSSSAEDALKSASAADKSSFAEDTSINSALEGNKGPSSESGNTPLTERKSSRACSPWGDSNDEEETKSSDPPKIDGKDSPLPALHAENTLASKRAGLPPVSERHQFKESSSSPEINAIHGECDDTDEEDSPPASGVRTVELSKKSLEKEALHLTIFNGPLS
jgi:hypothetical protein